MPATAMLPISARMESVGGAMCRAGRDGESSTGRAREEERGEGELKSRRAEREKVEQKQSRLRRPLSTSSENKKARESLEDIYFASRESQRERERETLLVLSRSLFTAPCSRQPLGAATETVTGRSSPRSTTGGCRRRCSLQPRRRLGVSPAPMLRRIPTPLPRECLPPPEPPAMTTRRTTSPLPRPERQHRL